MTRQGRIILPSCSNNLISASKRNHFNGGFSAFKSCRFRHFPMSSLRPSAEKVLLLLVFLLSPRLSAKAEREIVGIYVY